MVHGDLSVLVISGNPSLEEIEAAWFDISAQYSDAMGDAEFKMYVKLYKEIAILSADLDCIYILIDILQTTYNEDFLRELNKLLKTSMVLDPEKPVEYVATLKRCYNRSKGLKIEVDLKRLQFEAIHKKFNGQGKKPTMEYFDSILITLTDHAKVRVDDTISVYEFCERIKRFNNYYETFKARKK